MRMQTLAPLVLLGLVAIAESAETTTSEEEYLTPAGGRARAIKHAIPTTEAGPAIRVNAGATVAIGPATAGTCKVQYTVSLPSEVTAGSAVWIDWSAGQVTAWTTRVIEGQVHSVRGVSVTGACVLVVTQ